MWKKKKGKRKMPRAVPRSRGYPQIAQGAMGHISTRECRLLRNRLFSCTFHDEKETITIHVIQRNRQNARRGCTELFLLSWRRNLFAFLGGWFSRKQRAKWSFEVVTWTYIIHLEGFSLKRFSYSAIYYACSNFILFHTIAVETSIHVNSKYLYA